MAARACDRRRVHATTRRPSAHGWRRALSNPLVWSVPLTALLVYTLMPFNSDFYEDFINYDPQYVQTQEWAQTQRIFRYTSGMLCGQLVAWRAGVSLGRRNRHVTALALAIGLGLLLAGVTVALAYPLAAALEAGHVAPGPAADPLLRRVLVVELLAYPLFAAAGVGWAVRRGARRSATGSRRWLVPPLLVAGWAVVTLVGLMQDDGVFVAFRPLLWVVPPFAAAAVLSGAGLSRDVWDPPYAVVGDWGVEAGVALLVGTAASAVVLNVLGHRGMRRDGDARPSAPG